MEEWVEADDDEVIQSWLYHDGMKFLLKKTLNTVFQIKMT